MKNNVVSINPYNPEDIAWGIIQVLKSKDKAIQMGKNARERAIEVFSLDAVTKTDLLEFIKNLFKQNNFLDSCENGL